MSCEVPKRNENEHQVETVIRHDAINRVENLPGYKCKNCNFGKYRKNKKVNGWGTQYWCPKCTVEFADPKEWSLNKR